ncbi:hypothetical protein BJX76DRAFT_361999 [Aspergillus varians]
MASNIYFKVPNTISAWFRAASAAGVTNTTPKHHENLRSGSNITQSQFLSMRDLIQPAQESSFNPAHFQLEEHMDKARKLLTDSNGFTSYLNAITAGSFTATGDFGPLLKQQHEIRVAVYETNKLLRSDEAPVNAATISLLQAICDIHPRSTSWSIWWLILVAFPEKMRAEALWPSRTARCRIRRR